MKKYDIVMPVVRQDAVKIINNYEILKKYLNFNKIIMLGSEDVEQELKKIKNLKIEFINENEILDGLTFSKIKELISKRGGDPKRTGWYLQQFLKLGYSLICKSDYYIVWDSDTIPLKKIDFFDDNAPYFDIKSEYHKPYFTTIENLFSNNYKKEINGSFISEHMVFKTEYVRNMIEEINKNKKIPGNKFYEKIINAIDNVNNLNNSGFSEFETYGTFVYHKFKDSYKIRNWKSLREGIFYFPLPLNQLQINWLAKKYDAISFEKHDTLCKLNKLWNNKFVYNHFSIGFIIYITYPLMMIRKIVLRTMRSKTK